MTIQFNPAFSYYGLGRRANQEDARYPDQDSVHWRSGGFFVVCDGVGGEDCGEVASATVASAIGKKLENFDPAKPLTDQTIADILGEANKRLQKRANGNNSHMATTLTLLVAHANGVTAIHVGDSRIYQIRPGVGILFRSEDHSLVNALVQAGLLTPEEAETDPRSNVITRCLTADTQHTPDKASVTLLRDVRPGDYFVLATDGVLHCISDNQLYEILSAPGSDNEKRDRLRSLSHLSADNNTLWLVSVAAVDNPQPASDSGDVMILVDEEAPQQEQLPPTPPETHEVAPTFQKQSFLASLSSLFRKK